MTSEERRGGGTRPVTDRDATRDPHYCKPGRREGGAFQGRYLAPLWKKGLGGEKNES